MDIPTVREITEEYHMAMWQKFMGKDIMIILKSGEWIEGKAVSYDASHGSWIVNVSKVYLVDGELIQGGREMGVRGDGVKFVTLSGTLEKRKREFGGRRQ
jgi:small nuclear ribonucleoprotein (snRNP)-like protein